MTQVSPSKEAIASCIGGAALMEIPRNWRLADGDSNCLIQIMLFAVSQKPINGIFEFDSKKA
jgi:hypothetical protein